MPRSDPAEPPNRGWRCDDGDHRACTHEVGGSVSVALHKGRPAARRQVRLCRCSCHHACDLYGRSQVADEIWESDCTCPAAGPERERRRRRKEAVEQQRAQAKAETALILPELGLGPGCSAESIRADLLAALERHQLTWTEARIDRAVELAAAAHSPGPKPLVALRVTRAALRPYAQLWRLVKEAGASSDAADD